MMMDSNQTGTKPIRAMDLATLGVDYYSDHLDIRLLFKQTPERNASQAISTRMQ
jgi:hypothetical protein